MEVDMLVTSSVCPCRLLREEVGAGKRRAMLTHAARSGESRCGTNVHVQSPAAGQLTESEFE